MRQGSLPYEPALDGLRGVAVLFVVMFHAFPALLPGGWAGVDIFFVLSGYLITRLLVQESAQTDRVNLWQFYIRRALRLMPAFWCLLAAMLLMAIVASQKTELIRAWLFAASYLMNWARALGWGNGLLLDHTWSLAAEEQFYLLWPAAFLFVRSRRPWAWVLIATFAVVAWRCWLVLNGAPPTRTYSGFDTHSDPLLIGCLLGLVTIPDRIRSIISKTGPVSLIAMAVIVAAMDYTSTFTNTVGITLIALVSAGLIASSVSGHTNTILTAQPLVFTGKISYALYLWHYPLIAYAHAKLPGVTPLAPIMAAFAMAIMSTFTVERYFRRLKIRFEPRQSIASQTV